MKKKALVLLSVLLVMVMAVTAVGVSAKTTSDLKNQQQQIRDKIDSTQDKIDKVEGEIDETNGKIKKVKDKMAVLADEIKALADRYGKTIKQLNKKQKEYDQLEEDLAASQDSLRSKVADIYVNGDISLLDVVLSSESISDFISGFSFYMRIVESNQDLIDTIDQQQQAVAKKLDELNKTKEKLEGIQKEKEGQEAEYRTQVDKLTALVGNLEDKSEELHDDLDDYKSESDSVAKELQQIYQQQQSSKKPSHSSGDGPGGGTVSGGYDNGHYSGGTLAFPLSSYTYISQRYGHHGHTGVDFATPTGTTVYASEDGVAITVRYLNYSYGHYIVIDHGNGYATLYAHLSSIYISAGQKVSRGQVIASSGNTGNSTGPHLHYEVRYKGSCINPMSYL